MREARPIALVTGAAGVVGTTLLPVLLDAKYEVVMTDVRPPHAPAERSARWVMLDVRDFRAVRELLRDTRPAAVVHLAAMTSLEECEREPDAATLTNHIASRELATATQSIGAKFLFVSTAGVFDGRKSSGYVESDPTGPLNVYGATKRDAEIDVRRCAPTASILRAGWMMGSPRVDHKFGSLVLGQLKAGSRTIRAVTDKVGTVTSASDLAEVIVGMLARDHEGLLHVASVDAATRFEVACEMVALLNRKDVEVVPVTSDAFEEHFFARRPSSEILCTDALAAVIGRHLPSWRESLRRYVAELR